MNEVAGAERPSAAEEPPDSLFGLVGGLYLALLISPWVLAAAAFLATADAAVLYGVLLATVVAVTGAGWRYLAGRPGVAVALGRTRVRWLPTLAGLGVAAAGFASLEATGPVGVVGFFLGLFAMLLGSVLAMMSATRYVKAVTAPYESVTWRAGWPAGPRRRLQWTAGASAAVGLAAMTLGPFTDRFWLQVAGQAVFAAGAVALTWGQERDYAASEAGLELRLPVARRLHDWDAFERVERTGDAVVLRRRWRPDLRFALADLDDPDAVERALATHLS